MIDKRFYKLISPPLPLSKIAEAISATIENDRVNDANKEVLISSIASLKEAGREDLTFLSNQKYLEDFKATNAAACIVPYGFSISGHKNNTILLQSRNPYFSYTKAIDLFYRSNKEYPKQSISQIMPTAVVAKTAKIGKDCYIGHNAVIEENAVIGDDSIIEAGAFIDYGVVIGARAKISSHVSISYSIIGDDVVILSGAKIGQDGFGFSTHLGIHHKIFHTGKVIIGNNVEIGANTTIDRGSMNDTLIEDLCRIDNLVQIAHNVVIKKGTIIAGQVGISGSTHLGSYCAIGGQVGFAGHLKIGNQVQIAGGSGVGSDVEDKSVIGGYPAVKIKDWHRQTIILKNLVKKR